MKNRMIKTNINDMKALGVLSKPATSRADLAVINEEIKSSSTPKTRIKAEVLRLSNSREHRNPSPVNKKRKYSKNNKF